DPHGLERACRVDLRRLRQHGRDGGGEGKKECRAIARPIEEANTSHESSCHEAVGDQCQARDSIPPSGWMQSLTQLSRIEGCRTLGARGKLRAMHARMRRRHSLSRMLKPWSLLSLFVALAGAHAQAGPRAGADFVLRDFHFGSGQVLPELR